MFLRIVSCVLLISDSCKPMILKKVLSRKIPLCFAQTRHHSIETILKHFDQDGIHIREKLFTQSSEQEKLDFIHNLTNYLNQNHVRIILFEPHVFLSADAMINSYVEDCYTIKMCYRSKPLQEKQRFRDLLYVLQTCDYWEKVRKIS